jgi:hypothetical protein
MDLSGLRRKRTISFNKLKAAPQLAMGQALKVLHVFGCNKEAAVQIANLLMHSNSLHRYQTIRKVTMARQLQPPHQTLNGCELGCCRNTDPLTLKASTCLSAQSQHFTTCLSF